jgi:nucleotide-binding universal stress UspA family protein
MGTTGRRGTDRILLGSVAEKTVRTAPVPVVTVAKPE